jgi:hypothetical protein
MGHSVIIRSSADLWGLLSALGPGHRHRRQLRIDTAIKLLSSYDGLRVSWSGVEQVSKALVAATAKVFPGRATRLSKRLGGRIKADTLNQYLRGRRGVGFEHACIWCEELLPDHHLRVFIDAPHLVERLRGSALDLRADAPAHQPQPRATEPHVHPRAPRAGEHSTSEATRAREHSTSEPTERRKRHRRTRLMGSSHFSAPIFCDARAGFRLAMSLFRARGRADHGLSLLGQIEDALNSPNSGPGSALEKKSLPSSRSSASTDVVDSQRPHGPMPRLTSSQDRERELMNKEMEAALATERARMVIQRESALDAREARIREDERALEEAQRANRRDRYTLDLEAAQLADAKARFDAQVAAETKNLAETAARVEAELAEMKTRETKKLADDLADMKTREAQKIEDMKARETDKITRMQERFDAKMEAENERLAEAKARFQEFIREEKARADQRSERANRLIEIALNQGAEVLEQQPLSDFALITGEFLKLFKEREMKQ